MLQFKSEVPLLAQVHLAHESGLQLVGGDLPMLWKQKSHQTFKQKSHQNTLTETFRVVFGHMSSQM